MTTEEIIKTLWHILDFEHDCKYISKKEALAIRTAIGCVELVEQIKQEAEKAMVESC